MVDIHIMYLLYGSVNSRTRPT